MKTQTTLFNDFEQAIILTIRDAKAHGTTVKSFKFNNHIFYVVERTILLYDVQMLVDDGQVITDDGHVPQIRTTLFTYKYKF